MRTINTIFIIILAFSMAISLKSEFLHIEAVNGSIQYSEVSQTIINIEGKVGNFSRTFHPLSNSYQYFRINASIYNPENIQFPDIDLLVNSVFVSSDNIDITNQTPSFATLQTEITFPNPKSTEIFDGEYDDGKLFGIYIYYSLSNTDDFTFPTNQKLSLKIELTFANTMEEISGRDSGDPGYRIDGFLIYFILILIPISLYRILKFKK